MFLVGGAALWIALPLALIGQIWVGVGVLLALYFARVVVKARAAERIARDGIRGTARVLELTETGMQVNQRPLVKLRMRVEAPGIAPFEVKRRLVVPNVALGALHAGVLPVAIDRDDHSKVVIDWSGARPAAATAPIGALQAVAAASTPGAAPTAGAEARLEELDRLRDRGLITDAEYDSKRNDIIADL